LREKHSYTHFSGADHDRHDILVRDAPHEEVDEVVAVDEYFLEVVPTIGDAAIFLPQLFDLRYALSVEEVGGRGRHYVQDLARVVSDRVHCQEHSSGHVHESAADIVRNILAEFLECVVDDLRAVHR
jgi:hypothetical protein